MKITRPFTVILRSKVSARGVWHVAKKPLYIFVALVGFLFASNAIIWSLNLELVGYILFDAPLAVPEKLRFFSDTYLAVFSTFGSIQALGIIVFSILFAINTALVVFVFRHNGFSQLPKKSGSAGFVAAVLGGGCIACGTSLLAPLLATAGGVSSAALRDISSIMLWGASILVLFSIMQLGLLASSIKFAQRSKNN